MPIHHVKPNPSQEECADPPEIILSNEDADAWTVSPSAPMVSFTPKTITADDIFSMEEFDPAIELLPDHLRDLFYQQKKMQQSIQKITNQINISLNLLKK